MRLKFTKILREKVAEKVHSYSKMQITYLKNNQPENIVTKVKFIPLL